MVQITEPAKQETARWMEIRRTKEMLAEVSKWDAFTTGCRFAGKPLPIAVRSETIEYITMRLTADLVRLGATP